MLFPIQARMVRLDMMMRIPGVDPVWAPSSGSSPFFSSAAHSPSLSLWRSSKFRWVLRTNKVYQELRITYIWFTIVLYWSVNIKARGYRVTTRFLFKSFLLSPEHLQFSASISNYFICCPWLGIPTSSHLSSRQSQAWWSSWPRPVLHHPLHGHYSVKGRKLGHHSGKGRITWVG